MQNFDILTSMYPNPNWKMDIRPFFKYQKRMFSKLISKEEKFQYLYTFPIISGSNIINGFLISSSFGSLGH